jgi:hypothetical protein
MRAAAAGSSFVIGIATSGTPLERGIKDLCAGLINIVAVFSIAKYAIRYYPPDNPVQVGLTLPRRLVLVTHISGGIAALLVGTWQFSVALRRRYLRVHRLTGRIYLVSEGVVPVAALLLAITTRLGWVWGFGVGTFSMVWLPNWHSSSPPSAVNSPALPENVYSVRRSLLLPSTAYGAHR